MPKAISTIYDAHHELLWETVCQPGREEVKKNACLAEEQEIYTATVCSSIRRR